MVSTVKLRPGDASETLPTASVARTDHTWRPSTSGPMVIEPAGGRMVVRKSEPSSVTVYPTTPAGSSLDAAHSSFTDIPRVKNASGGLETSGTDGAVRSTANSPE